MQEVKQPNQYTAVSVHKDDKAFYETIRQELMQEKGLTKLSLADTIKIGMTSFNQRRKNDQKRRRAEK